MSFENELSLEASALWLSALVNAHVASPEDRSLAYRAIAYLRLLAQKGLPTAEGDCAGFTIDEAKALSARRPASNQFVLVKSRAAARSFRMDPAMAKPIIVNLIRRGKKRGFE